MINHRDGCMCFDCKLDRQQAAREVGCGTVPREVTIPADLSHTGQERQAVKPLDACIANLVRELNRAGVETRGSCCGHGGQGEIILGDGYVLKVKPLVHVSVRVGDGCKNEDTPATCEAVFPGLWCGLPPGHEGDHSCEGHKWK